MKKLKPHYVLTQSQRNGVFALAAVIVLVLLGIVLLPSFFTKPVFADENLEKLRMQVDSLRRIDSIEKVKRQQKIYPFNPNFISDYKGYTLGMTPEEIDRLHAFRAEGKWINSSADFKRVTKVPDSIFLKIAPFFKFPDWVVQKQKKNAEKSSTKVKLSYADKADLNKVTQADLQNISGVGEVLSLRIIRYRNKLGGFVDDIQLKDIYGLKTATRIKILEKFTVKSGVKPQKINLNTASVLDLVEVVYFDYELARAIVAYRKLHEGIQDFEELTKIEGFPAYKLDRIKLYLAIEK